MSIAAPGTPNVRGVDMKLEVIVSLFLMSIAPSAFTAAWGGGSTPTLPPTMATSA